MMRVCYDQGTLSLMHTLSKHMLTHYQGGLQRFKPFRADLGDRHPAGGGRAFQLGCSNAHGTGGALQGTAWQGKQRVSRARGAFKCPCVLHKAKLADA